MSKNNIHSNSTEISSARSEKKQIVNMKGRKHHVSYPLVIKLFHSFKHLSSSKHCARCWGKKQISNGVALQDCRV